MNESADANVCESVPKHLRGRGRPRSDSWVDSYSYSLGLSCSLANSLEFKQASPSRQGNWLERGLSSNRSAFADDLPQVEDNSRSGKLAHYRLPRQRCTLCKAQRSCNQRTRVRQPQRRDGRRESPTADSLCVHRVSAVDLAFKNLRSPRNFHRYW